MLSIENGGYVYDLEYRSDLFEDETAGYMIENLEIAAKAFLDGKEPLEIRLLFDEADKMVNTPRYTGRTFVDLFREAVSKYPYNVAVRDENGTITYAELDAVSEYIAEKLTKNGFGRENVAGILCGRTREFAEAVVGTMKAGGAYVPLDPEYPQDRIEYMLSDSGSENLLVMSKYKPLVSGYDKNVIYLDDIEEKGMNFAGKAELTPPLPETMPTQMGELVVETLAEDCALKMLMLGGEKFKRYYDTKYVLVNAYGPTENTVSTTEFIVDKDYKTIPIGKSQLNVRCYIVDENMKRVPVGATGELCVAGRQVARGYHNLPEKTASVFVPNPFAVCKDEERLYHTGDMVRMKDDGNIEYIGRIDTQIKINGFRVELGEIEGAILKRDGIFETAAIPVEQSGVTYIAAYYTGAEYPEDDWKALGREKVGIDDDFFAIGGLLLRRPRLR